MPVILKRAFSGLLFSIIIIGVANVIGAIWPRSVQHTESIGHELHEIYLVAGPIHYDFVLPHSDVTKEAFKDVIAVPQTTRHLLIGWGSAAFYTTAGQYSDIKLSAVWTAATGDSAVLRLDSIGAFNPEQYDAIVLRLSDEQLDSLPAFVLADFERDKTGAVIPSDVAGLGATDQFFDAKGRFNALRTCNVWVAEALAAVGVSVGVWTPTPIGLRASLAWHR